MSTVRIEIETATAAEALYELSALMAKAQQRDTSSSTLDRKYEDKLSADAYRAEGYAAGLRDAKSEAAQERVFAGNKSLEAMLGHESVMLCPQDGHAPFPFRPRFICAYRASPTYEAGSIVPADSVGIYGVNLLTNEQCFYVRVDHWTLRKD